MGNVYRTDPNKSVSPRHFLSQAGLLVAFSVGMGEMGVGRGNFQVYVSPYLATSEDWHMCPSLTNRMRRKWALWLAKPLGLLATPSTLGVRGERWGGCQVGAEITFGRIGWKSRSPKLGGLGGGEGEGS